MAQAIFVIYFNFIVMPNCYTSTSNVTDAASRVFIWVLSFAGYPQWTRDTLPRLLQDTLSDIIGLIGLFDSFLRVTTQQPLGSRGLCICSPDIPLYSNRFKKRWTDFSVRIVLIMLEKSGLPQGRGKEKNCSLKEEEGQWILLWFRENWHFEVQSGKMML